MRIDIISSVPDLLASPLNESILKRAQEKGLVEIVVHNLHDYAHDRRIIGFTEAFEAGGGEVLFVSHSADPSEGVRRQ